MFFLNKAKIYDVLKVEKCLSPKKPNVYRLLEMGLCHGAKIKVLNIHKNLDTMEILLNNTRLCLDFELASNFLVTFQGTFK